MKIKRGDKVKVHYVGKLDTGEVFDSSVDRGEAIEFVTGIGQMIEGFDNAVLGMSVGEKKTVTMTSTEAYGDVREDLMQTVPVSDLPPGAEVGATLTGQGQNGPIMVRIVEMNGESAKVDFNHPLAGKNLTFDIEAIEISVVEGETVEGETVEDNTTQDESDSIDE